MLCKQCRRLFSASEDSNTFNSRRVHCVFLNKGMLDNPKPNIETVKKKLSKQNLSIQIRWVTWAISSGSTLFAQTFLLKG